MVRTPQESGDPQIDAILRTMTREDIRAELRCLRLLDHPAAKANAPMILIERKRLLEIALMVSGVGLR
jgi:hypothetical protein